MTSPDHPFKLNINLTKGQRAAVVVLLVAVLVVTLGSHRGGLSTSLQPGDSEPTTAQLISAYNLEQEYTSNELSADSRYKGTSLLVGGYVGMVQRGAFGGTTIGLQSSPTSMPMLAELRDGQENAAMRLSSGQAVALACIGGGMTMGRPVLTRCKIMPLDGYDHIAMSWLGFR